MIESLPKESLEDALSVNMSNQSHIPYVVVIVSETIIKTVIM